MKHQTERKLMGLLIAALLVLAAAGPRASAAALSPTVPTGLITVPPGSPIEIAVAAMYDYGAAQDLFDAIAMAVADYGNIRGFEVQDNHYDSGCDQAGGENAASAIIANTQNVGVVGPFCSLSTRGAAPIFEANGVVMISPSNTAADLSAFGPNIFNRVVLEDPYYEGWDAAISALPSVQDWQAEFLAEFGRQPDGLAKYAYDATTLLLRRIDQVSALNGGNLEIDRAELATAVRETFDFAGVTGQIVLAFNGDRINTLAQAVRVDQFKNATLAEAWSWVDEDPTHWSLTDRPGYLRIMTQEEAHNWLVRRVPYRDLVIRTHLYFTPTQNFQFAGLTVFLDADNRLSFGRAYCDTPAPDCVENGIYFDHVEGGQLIGSNFATATSVPDEVYLRLVRQQSSYTGYFSPNGTEWIEVGTHGIGFEPTGMGLFAQNQGALSEIPADFDYFAWAHAYNRVFLPISVNKP